MRLTPFWADRVLQRCTDRHRLRIWNIQLWARECSGRSPRYGRRGASLDLRLIAFTAGSYTVIVSTFEAQKNLGPFSLRAESSRRISLEAIPQEGAGMYSKVVKGSWFVTTPGMIRGKTDERILRQGGTAAGSPSSARYMKNPISHLHIPSTCQIK